MLFKQILCKRLQLDKECRLLALLLLIQFHLDSL